MENRISEKMTELEDVLEEIPKKVLGFLVKKYVSESLVFSTEKPWQIEFWTNRILDDSSIWISFDRFFTSLNKLGLCVKTYNYVATRRGELRELCYVISPEIQEFLVNNFSLPYFTPEQERMLNLYSFLTSIAGILSSEDIDYIRQRFYELLKRYSLTEEQVAGFIHETSKRGITNDYQGLLSKGKPFNLKDTIGFKIYLDESIVEPAISLLLEKGKGIKQYVAKEKFLPLSEVKAEKGILENVELGSFYIMISNFEIELRRFLQTKLGSNWMKILENELHEIPENWKKLERRDKRWGIEPEHNLMNYASFDDYVKIIEKHKRIFSDNAEDLGNILTKLKDWYNHGRNPLMHCRTVNRQKFDTAKSAIQFLEQWIKRKSNIGLN